MSKTLNGLEYEYYQKGVTAGQAIRPVTEPGGTTPIPGYESPICWTLIGNAPTGTGTYCGIRAPAADCTQAVCL